MNIREAITKPIPTANTKFQTVERNRTTIRELSDKLGKHFGK